MGIISHVLLTNHQTDRKHQINVFFLSAGVDRIVFSAVFIYICPKHDKQKTNQTEEEIKPKRQQIKILLIKIDLFYRHDEENV